jgi:sulfite reductase (NADPH) hemoprotein beta-component
MASSAVARIAYLSSDVLITAPSSTYTLPSSSSSSPTVEVLPGHADPAVFALRHASSSKLTSFLLADSNPSPFTRLVPSLSSLAKTSTVVHVVLPKSSDLSDVIALRSAGWVILLSSTFQDAHDHSVIAAKLARQANKAVLHVFTESEAGEVEEVDEEKLKAFLDAPLRQPETNGNGNGHSHHPQPELFKT